MLPLVPRFAARSKCRRLQRLPPLRLLRKQERRLRPWIAQRKSRRARTQKRKQTRKPKPELKNASVSRKNARPPWHGPMRKKPNAARTKHARRPGWKRTGAPRKQELRKRLFQPQRRP